MTEYIEREKAIKALKDNVTEMECHIYFGSNLGVPKDEIEDIVNEIPAADVEPVKHGEWKYIKSGEGVFDYYFECSECHASTPNKAYPTNPNFCPHCGSKNVSLDCGICCVNYKDGKEVQE